MQKTPFFLLDDFENLRSPFNEGISLDILLPHTTYTVYSYLSYDDEHFNDPIKAGLTLAQIRHTTKRIYHQVLKLVNKESQNTTHEIWNNLNRSGEKVLRSSYKEETLLWFNVASKWLRDTFADKILTLPSSSLDLNLEQWKDFYHNYITSPSGKPVGDVIITPRITASETVVEDVHSKSLSAIRHISRNLVFSSKISPYINGWYLLNNDGQDLLRGDYIAERTMWLEFITKTLLNSLFSRR